MYILKLYLAISFRKMREVLELLVQTFMEHSCEHYVQTMCIYTPIPATLCRLWRVFTHLVPVFYKVHECISHIGMYAFSNAMGPHKK